MEGYVENPFVFGSVLIHQKMLFVPSGMVYIPKGLCQTAV